MQTDGSGLNLINDIYLHLPSTARIISNIFDIKRIDVVLCLHKSVTHQYPYSINTVLEHLVEHSHLPCIKSLEYIILGVDRGSTNTDSQAAKVVRLEILYYRPQSKVPTIAPAVPQSYSSKRQVDIIEDHQKVMCLAVEYSVYHRAALIHPAIWLHQVYLFILYSKFCLSVLSFEGELLF